MNRYPTPTMTEPTPTTETPIAEYGLVEVSRPVAAALLGFSLKALNRQIRDGQITANGRVKKMVFISQVEAIRGKHVSIHDYLTAAYKPPPGGRHDGRHP